MQMSSPDPFSRRFEVFGREPQGLVESINRPARDLLTSYLDENLVDSGRVILLQAPRAGYGKTALLQAVAGDLGESHRFVRVQLTNGRTTDAAHVLEYVLQSLCQVVPESTTLTQLDLLAREVLALGLEPLVASGEVPCQDRESALKNLRDNPAQTFDFHHDGAVTAHWAKSNFEVLGPRLAAELAAVTGASLRESSYWVELLFRFATTPPDNVERARLLFETIFRNDLQNQSSSTAEERLQGLLSLMATVASPVLVVDDTEGLSTSPQDALALSSFLSNISQSCPGTSVILSVNDDIWESSFLPHLPGGLADRLLAYKVTLEALKAEEVEAIINKRAGDRAGEVRGQINWSATGETLYPRLVVELASSAWSRLDHKSLNAAVACGYGEEVKVVPQFEGAAIQESSEAPTEEDPLAGLPDFSVRDFASVKIQEPREETSVPVVGGFTEKVIEEDISVLDPQPAVVQAYESPFAPVSKVGENSPNDEQSDLPVVPVDSVATTENSEPSSSEIPSPSIQSPFEQLSEVAPEHPSGLPGDSPAAYPSPFEEVSEVVRPVQEAQAGESTLPNSGEPSTEEHGDQIAATDVSTAASNDHPSSWEPDPPSPARLIPEPDLPPREPEATSNFRQEFHPADQADPVIEEEPSPEDLDPTGGEIEFAKLKPLSEMPPTGEPPVLREAGGDDGDTLAETVDRPPLSAPEPVHTQTVSPEPVPNHDTMDVVAPQQMVQKDIPVAPEPSGVEVSPFSAAPRSPADIPEEASSLPGFTARPSPAREPAEEDSVAGDGQEEPTTRDSSDTPQDWWPGDPPTKDSETSLEAPAGDSTEGSGQGSREVPAQVSSPFVAVGTPPARSSYESPPEGQRAPYTADPAAGDREEVERMLRALRERQEKA